MNKLNWLIKALLFSFLNWFFFREVLISSNWKLALCAWCGFVLFIQLAGGSRQLRPPLRAGSKPQRGGWSV